MLRRFLISTTLTTRPTTLPTWLATVFGPVAFALVILGGCAYLPRSVEGVPETHPWFSIPLAPWLSEDRGELEAISACDECGAGIVVGTLKLTGPEADKAEAALKDSRALARFLARPRTGKAEIATDSRAFTVGSDRGFILSMARADEKKPPVWGGAVGRRSAMGLSVIIVIGGDAKEVEATIRGIAAKHWDS